jgi:microcystin degradation protein MlrC
VKSTIHYRAAFEPLAHAIVEVDAPGLSSSNLGRFDFQRVRRPIFPLDRDCVGGPDMAPHRSDTPRDTRGAPR